MEIFFSLHILARTLYSFLRKPKVVNQEFPQLIEIKVASSDPAFKSISLYSNPCFRAAAPDVILRWILDCILVGIIYPWLRWIIYTPENPFFLPKLFQGLTLGKEIYISLGDFWPGVCCSHCFPKTQSWESCHLDWTWICQGSPWGWLEICCQQHCFSHGLHHRCSLWDSGNLYLQLHNGRKLREVYSWTLSISALLE